MLNAGSLITLEYKHDRSHSVLMQLSRPYSGQQNLREKLSFAFV